MDGLALLLCGQCAQRAFAEVKQRWSVIGYIHTYHSRFIPEGVAEVSQIFLRDRQTSTVFLIAN
jgi:hypothetical protein